MKLDSPCEYTKDGEVFTCPMKDRCKEHKLACDSYVFFLKTGHILPPHYQQADDMMYPGEVQPSREIYNFILYGP